MSSLSLLLLGAMLAGCVPPIVVPSTTPVPPTAAPQPPTAMPVLQTTTAPPATAGPAGKIGVAFTKMTSKALANNLIGDRAKRTTYLLLPPSYETSEKRYPVVYVLHEYSGDATSLVEDFQQSYQAVPFNDTGTGVLDLGITGDEDYFAAGVSVAAAGGQMVAFSQSPVLAGQAGVVAKYTGQNGDATQGRARVAVAYGTPFYPH